MNQRTLNISGLGFVAVSILLAIVRSFETLAFADTIITSIWLLFAASVSVHFTYGTYLSIKSDFETIKKLRK